MKPAVTTLTEDQAVDELAAILDSAPSEDQVLELSVWKRDHTFRAQQLEAHIVHLQGLAKKQDALPQHLQPEVATPAVGTQKSPEKEKRPVTPKKTPKEKLQTLVGQYERARARVLPDPGNRLFRNRANVIKSHLKALCKEFKLQEPKLEPLPELPDPKPRNTWTKKVKAAPAPSKVDEVLDKHLPSREEAHPYEPPTLEELGITTVARAREVGEALLASQGPPWDIPTVPLVHVEDPPVRAPEPSQADIYAHHAGPQREPSYTALEIARYLAGSFWPLCQQIEEMPDREQIRPALDVIHTRLQMAYALVDEGGVEQAG